jgi:hypothetical protein
METVLSILVSILTLILAPILGWAIAVAIFAIPVGVCAMGIASGSDKWESEDQAQYERFNPRVKSAREIHRKEQKPLQSTESTVTLAKKPENSGASGHDLGDTRDAHSLMKKQVFYCLENQSVDQVRRIMREHDLPYLIVLDKRLRVVGTVWMRDLPPRNE